MDRYQYEGNIGTEETYVFIRGYAFREDSNMKQRKTDYWYEDHCSERHEDNADLFVSVKNGFFHKLLSLVNS